MTIFRLPRFLRRFFRGIMRPMGEDRAWTMKEKIAMVYAFIAWNALAAVGYQVYKGNVHWPKTMGVETAVDDVRPSVYFANVMGIKKAQVYKVSGFNVTKDEINLDELKAKEKKTEQ